MTNELRGSNRSKRALLRHWLSMFLFALWLVGTVAIWIEFAHAPVGALAAADAGRLVAIRDSTVITTSGYFNVSEDPSALRATPMRVIRTNSLWSDSGLQLCTARNAGDDNWCNDIIDGYAGKLSETAFARRAWSRGTMIAILLLAFGVTLFGWLPAVVVASGGDVRSLTSET